MKSSNHHHLLEVSIFSQYLAVCTVRDILIFSEAASFERFLNRDFSFDIERHVDSHRRMSDDFCSARFRTFYRTYWRNFGRRDADKRVEPLLEVFPHQVVDEQVGERANAEHGSGDERERVDERVAAVWVGVKDSREDGRDESDEENNLKNMINLVKYATQLGYFRKKNLLS